MYVLKSDANGNAVQEAISEIVEVTMSAAAPLTDAVVAVPSEAHGVVLKRLPDGDVKIAVNGKGRFTVDEGDKIGPFIAGIKTLAITTTTTSTDNLVIQFIK